MDTKAAIKILRKEGYIITGKKDNWIINYPKWGNPDTSSDRELCNLAKEFTSEGNRTNIKKNTKWDRHKTNRAKTRELLGKENYDDFPSNGLAKDSDPWSWD